MVPLYGTNIDELIALVRGHEFLLELVRPQETIEKKLRDFQTSMNRIAQLSQMVIVFLASMAALMIILLTMSLRMHIRIFDDEKRVANLVGAHPIWYW